MDKTKIESKSGMFLHISSDEMGVTSASPLRAGGAGGLGRGGVTEGGHLSLLQLADNKLSVRSWTMVHSGPENRSSSKKCTELNSILYINYKS